MKHLAKSAVISVLILAIVFAFAKPVFADGNIYKKGDNSNDVAKIQQALKELKLFNEDVTGYFGDITEEAVKKFQKQNNLIADGIVGPRTLLALFGNTSLSNILNRGEVERIKINVTYKIQEGDTLSSIAEDYGISLKALADLNNLPEDAVLQPDQELKIPEDTENTEQSQLSASDAAIELKGEYLGWFDTVQYIFEKNDIATVTDIITGKSFKVKRLYGRYHADVEPLTKDDTAEMKTIYGSWSWERRAIIVTIDGKNIAASMNGMPHGGEQINNNGFKGHFCIHFKGSKTHVGNKVDATHQAAVKLAAGIKQ